MKRLLMTRRGAGARRRSPGEALARDQIRIVGSSTVFPFTTAVAEQFGSKSGLKTPVVESTGTGGGMKLFCGGVGEEHPDFTNASRRIKESELEACAKAGVDRDHRDQDRLRRHRAGQQQGAARRSTSPSRSSGWRWRRRCRSGGKLVANPYQSWNEIDPSLPNETIEVLGPPPTSGTRDAFVELVMDVGCEEFAEVKALDGDAKTAACQTIREDGVYIDAGENDNLIVQKLDGQPERARHLRLQLPRPERRQAPGQHDRGVEPTFENIADGKYPVSRSLYIYAKNAHVERDPRHARVHRRVSRAMRPSARTATSPTRA